MSPLRGFIEFCRGRLRPLALGVLATTAVAVLIASDLRIDSNLQRLLPHSAPSVASLDRLEESYAGALGRLTIVLEGDERGELVEHTPAIAERIAELREVDRVEHRRPAAFFRAFRFLYADYADLQTVERRLERRIVWEKRRANPLFVDVSDEEPPEVDVSDIIARYDESRRGDYYLDQAGDRLAIFVFPTFPAKDLSRSRRLVDRVRGVVSEYLADRAPDLEFALTGRYKKRVDLQDLLASDLTAAMLIATSVLAVFMLLVTRSFTGLALILVPLATGTIWTFAWAEIAFQSLNLLTAFLGAILVGLGVDYGIHLHFHYFESHRHHSPTEALIRTFRRAGRANLFAGLTTMVPLASLITSDFQAFYEFGIIAVGGIASILLAYAVLFPCLVFAFANRELSPREPLSARLVSLATSPLLTLERRRPRLPSQLARAAAAVAGLLAIPALLGTTDLQFNRDFHVLQSTQAPSWRLDEEVNEILGRSQTPTVVLTDSPAHSRRVVDELRDRAEQAPGGYTIDEVLSLQSLLPDRQEAKLAILRDLDRQLDELPDEATDEDLAEYAEELDRILAEAPLDLGGLPEHLTAPFERLGEGEVVLIFPAVDLTATDKFEDFVDVTLDLPGIGYEQGYDAISEALLLYDIMRFVERDATRMLLLTLLGLLAVSLLALRSLRDSLLQFGMLLAAIGCAIGWTGLLGVEFNFLNIIILPIWLGLGIDATFHMLFNLRENPTRLAPHLTTALAIAVAFLTTMLGFGSMLVAHHEGLHSLGEIAVLGLGVLMVTNLLMYAYLTSDARIGDDESAAGETTRHDESGGGESGGEVA